MPHKLKVNNSWLIPALFMLGRFAGLIVFPVMVGIIIGIYLDIKYKTDPWLFVISVGISFIVSIIGLTLNTFKEFKRIEKQIKEQKEK